MAISESTTDLRSDDYEPTTTILPKEIYSYHYNCKDSKQNTYINVHRWL